MAKIKIEIRKPQYITAQGTVAEAKKEKALGKKTPFVFRLLLVVTYILSGLAIWFVFQKVTAPS